MPDPEKPARQVDAVLVPYGHAGGNIYTKMARFQAEFGPLLGGGRLWVRDVGGANLVAPNEADTLNFPTDHPTRPKQPRYAWEDRGDGVKLGVLVPDDDVVPGGPAMADANATAAGKLRARLAAPATATEPPHAG